MSTCRTCPRDPNATCRPRGVDRRTFVTRLLPAALAASAAFAVPGSALGEVVWGESGQQPAGELSFPIPAADGVVIDRFSPVVIVRRGGQVMAFSRSCPHEQADLRWREADGRFQCPRHESKFEPDGTLVSGRASRHMDRLAIRREGGLILVDASRILRSDLQPAEWAAAVVTV
jgi:cytochrome b6-f complex iron-sulfur subunit